MNANQTAVVMTPKVSIVINNYNYSNFLRVAIDSALTQDYQNFEVLVVDDGSTDCSRDVIEAYGSTIKAVFKNNGGQASAMNTGINACSGEYVLFLDSDDALVPSTLSAAMSIIPAGYSRLAYALEAVDEEFRPLGRVLGGERFDGDPLEAFKERHYFPAVPTSGNIFSRSALVSCGPIPEAEFRISADLYLFVSTAKYGNVLSIPTVLGKYRIHRNNNFYGKLGSFNIKRWRNQASNVVQSEVMLERLVQTRYPEYRSARLSSSSFYIVRSAMAKVLLSPNQYADAISWKVVFGALASNTGKGRTPIFKAIAMWVTTVSLWMVYPLSVILGRTK